MNTLQNHFLNLEALDMYLLVQIERRLFGTLETLLIRRQAYLSILLQQVQTAIETATDTERQQIILGLRHARARQFQIEKQIQANKLQHKKSTHLGVAGIISQKPAPYLRTKGTHRRMSV